MERARLNDEMASLVAAVEAAKSGESRALEAFVELTQRRLYRFLLFLAGDRALANDLCQDTYLYAFEHLKDLDEPRAVWRWLFLVAKNKFYDHRKSPRNKAHVPVETLNRDDGGSSAERSDLVLGVREALDALSADERAVLLLVDMEEHSVAEAAKILKISESAAQSRVRRARAAFHQKYFK